MLFRTATIEFDDDAAVVSSSAVVTTDTVPNDVKYPGQSTTSVWQFE